LRVKQAQNIEWPWAVVFVATIVVASTAQASEGSLQLLPTFTDLLGKFPLLIALFVLLIFFANGLLYKPIFRVLDERQARTAGTRQRAEQIVSSADETLSNYKRAVRDVREEAESDRKRQAALAREENASVTAAARAETESEMERAQREISEALEQARQTLRADAQSLAREAASRVLGRSL
jgi:F-type H+-transporting ATPase subunit b